MTVEIFQNLSPASCTDPIMPAGSFAVIADIIKEMGNEEVVASVSSSEADLGIIFYSTERVEKYHNMVEQAGLIE